MGQGWLVWKLTGSTRALGLVTFAASAPLFFLSPLGGWLADRANKRVVLVLAQIGLASTAFVLAAAVWFHFESFGLVLVLASINGCISVIEIPARQATVSNIVAPEELANALPLNSGTFNLARILGPAIGGQLLATYGTAGCFLVNGLSFAALIFAVLAIRADLGATGDRSATLAESLFGGIAHVAKTPAFRTVVSMMMVTSVFGLFYMSLFPAVATKIFRLGEVGYSSLATATGIGAILGVLIITALSKYAVKGWIPILSMVGLGISLLVFSQIRIYWQGLMCLVFIGMFALGQMAGTNTALQYYGAPKLRGRIISVHIWSLAGLGPLGAMLFGYVSDRYGLPAAFKLGGTMVLFFGLLALFFGKSLRRLS